VRLNILFFSYFPFVPSSKLLPRGFGGSAWDTHTDGTLERLRFRFREPEGRWFWLDTLFFSEKAYGKEINNPNELLN